MHLKSYCINNYKCTQIKIKNDIEIKMYEMQNACVFFFTWKRFLKTKSYIY